jgi:YfiH family protein
MEFTRKNVNGAFVNYYENDGMVLGFTETGFNRHNLSTFFKPGRLVELKQVHSNIIRTAGEIRQCRDGMPETEGDGIILEETGTMAVIKTADCTPLFFWNREYTVGGVIHIGWQGLLKGIEKKLAALLREKSIPPGDIYFHLGPAIEKKCYEVGPDLHQAFEARSYRDAIFSYKQVSGKGNKVKYVMDVKKGICLSLRESGVPVRNISDTHLCTFCHTERFPSYRRDKAADRRIYNFLLLKSIKTESCLGNRG